MDGYETATFIRNREKTCHIPIIFVTAVNKEEHFVSKGYSTGAVDYLAKPLDADILKAKVAVFVDLFQYAQENRRQGEQLLQTERRMQTERRAAERQRMSEDQRHLTELAASEARLSEFKKTLDATLDGVFIFDAHDLNFSYINHGGAGQLGYDPDEILTLTPLDILPERDAAILRDKLDALREGRLASYTFQTQQRRKDGSEIPVELFLQFVVLPDKAGRFVAVARDITERRSAEAALRKVNDELELHVMERTGELRTANEELRTEMVERQRAVEAQQESYDLLLAVTEGTTDCVFVKDLQGRYMMINSAGALRRKKTVAEILGKVDTDLFSPETACIIMEADRRVLAADTTQTFEETTVEDGVTRTHLVTKGPHRNPHGAVIGIVGITRDITARKQQEVELQRAKQEADTANRAKSEFLSRMSHELRTPLNSILGFSQILNKEDLDPLSKEGVGYIIKGGQHLLSLINEVLDIARVEAGHVDLSLETIALNEVVPEACALMGPLAAGRSIRLSENTSALSHCHVLADHQRLKQVLINLLSNAIKYNRAGGEVEVICGQKPDGWISIAVRDTGPGISPEDLPKLFMPFERLEALKSDIEGSGLGLVLSQALVTAMAGSLTVESTLGRGTTFTLVMPQATPPQEQLTIVPEAASLLVTSQEDDSAYSILCVEDNPANLRLIEVHLRSRPNITLLTSIQGSMGLDLARQHKPGLILLDLHLPDIQGDEFLSRLQRSALTRDIPVVVVSADATPKQIERLMAAGAKDYLTKPLNIDRFLRTLDKFLGVT